MLNSQGRLSWHVQNRTAVYFAIDKSVGAQLETLSNSAAAATLHAYRPEQAHSLQLRLATSEASWSCRQRCADFMLTGYCMRLQVPQTPAQTLNQIGNQSLIISRLYTVIL